MKALTQTIQKQNIFFYYLYIHIIMSISFRFSNLVYILLVDSTLKAKCNSIHINIIDLKM